MSATDRPHHGDCWLDRSWIAWVLLQASASRSRYPLGVRVILSASRPHASSNKPRARRPSPDGRVRLAATARHSRPELQAAASWRWSTVKTLLVLEENLAEAGQLGPSHRRPSTRHELGRLLETPGFGILGAFRKSERSRPAYGHQHRRGRGSAEQEAPPGLQPLGLRRISSDAVKIDLRQAAIPRWLFINHRDASLAIRQLFRRCIGPPRAKQPRLHWPDRGDHSADPAGRTVGLLGIRNAPLADPARSTTIDRTGPWGAG